jgi:hypothetical protein
MITFNILKRKQVTLFVLQLLFFLINISIYNNNLWGLNIELEPYLGWQLYYEDNIAGITEQSSSSKISGFSNRYQPELKLNIASSRVAILVNTRALIYRYISEKDWDNTDKNYNIQCDLKVNPRSDLTVFASYNLDTNILRNFIQEEGAASGTFVVRKSPYLTKSYGANYNYKFSTRGTIGFNFNYVLFSSSASRGSPVYSYNMNYDYLLSNNTNFSLSMGYNQLKFNYVFAGEFLNYKLQTYNINGGLTHKFSETFKLIFSSGWSFTDIRQRRPIFVEDPLTGEQVIIGTESVTNTTPGSNFNFRLEKILYHATISFTGNQSLYTNPESGETYPTRSFGINVSYNFSSKIEATIGWSYYQNKSNAGDYNSRVDSETKSYYNTIKLMYHFEPNVDLSLGYIRAKSDTKSSNDAEIIYNTVFMQCTFQLPRPFIVR